MGFLCRLGVLNAYLAVFHARLLFDSSALRLMVQGLTVSAVRCYDLTCGWCYLFFFCVLI